MVMEETLDDMEVILRPRVQEYANRIWPRTSVMSVACIGRLV